MLSTLTFVFSQYRESDSSLIVNEFRKQGYKNFSQDKEATFSFKQSFFLNNNLPNMENLNGINIPKGYGTINSLFLKYSNNFLSFTIEPQLFQNKKLVNNKKNKEKNYLTINQNRLKNLGILFSFSNLKFGYGNWGNWVGPGVHNSLLLSNNSESFNHFKILLASNFKFFKEKIDYKIKYITSEALKNSINSNFYISLLSINFNIKKINYGYNKIILSGGQSEIEWSKFDANFVIISNDNIHIWDQIESFHIEYEDLNTGLIIYTEIGYPNRSFGDKNPENYNRHNQGTLLGFRKYGVLNNDNLMFGLEYLRLVQGYYYNILPTKNWYDDIKYNYYKINGKYMGAHSGPDSDDFIIYFGFLNRSYSGIISLNYERRGVTYHFPPEVKFEYRMSIGYQLKNINISINYENEYLEHFNFMDLPQNVWEETFEPGSIQRTKTLLLSLEYKI